MKGEIRTRTGVFCLLLKWTKSGKEVIYGKKKWGSPSIQESKIAVKFSKRLSICTVTSLRDISEKTWVHSYPMMPHAFTFHSCGKCLHQLASSLPSWSAMHDVCMTCVKKSAVAMGANVLNKQGMKLIVIHFYRLFLESHTIGCLVKN